MRSSMKSIVPKIYICWSQWSQKIYSIWFFRLLSNSGAPKKPLSRLETNQSLEGLFQDGFSWNVVRELQAR